MPTFEIETAQGRFQVEAPNEQAAVNALKPMAAPKPVTASPHGKADAFVGGALDGATLGFLDEAAAVPGFLANKILPGGDSRSYSTELDRIRGELNGAQEANPASFGAGQIAGGIGTALAASPVSMGANALRGGAGLGRVALGSAFDGAALGGLSGAGAGEGLEGKLGGAAQGAAIGGVLGGALPYATAGASAALQPLVSPVMARLQPDRYAATALGDGLRRAGQTPDDLATALLAAHADDQPMFTVADAMGHAGQRMLSTVARNPNEGRQAAVEALQARQVGQGERLAASLARGFNAPDTAVQRATQLTADRTALANVNYANARNGAGPVNVSGALAEIDDVLRPGVNRLANPASNIADDSLEGVVRRAQRLLTDGDSQLTDFNSVLRAKQDIQDMVGSAQRQGRNNQVRLLSQINDRLDAALERASPGYRDANDAFRAQSRTIDAVEAGGAAASGRTRAADNIARFNGMEPAERAAFRAGYVDPMIARVESASMSPTTNKVRNLISEKTGQEFPAFAVPQRADRMGRQIAREQRMFETANAALGGSKTADNLADAADLAQFDPSIMMHLFSGRPVAAMMAGLGRLLNESRGLPPTVLTQLSRALMETNPAAARQILQVGANRAATDAQRRAIINSLMTGTGASAAGRLLGAP